MARKDFNIALRKSARLETNLPVELCTFEKDKSDKEKQRDVSNTTD